MMKRFPLVVILTVLFNVTAAQASQLKPDEKLALEAKPAVVLVVVQLRATWTYLGVPIKLEPGAIGTGFFFRPDGYLITNGHVVQLANMKDPQAETARLVVLRTQALQHLEKMNELLKAQTGKSFPREFLVEFVKKGDIQVLDSKLTLALANRKFVNAEILQYSDPITAQGKDVAILKAPGSNYPTVPLGNSDLTRLQDAIVVMGFPGVAYSWGDNPLVGAESNFEASATNGHISAVKTSASGVPLLQSDVAITHGNSGGPAFNDQGQVIGIATAGAESVQGFNFLVPINTAMEFVHQTGVQGEAGPFNDHWYQALALFDAGQFRKSITEFDNVLQFMPDLPDAKKYRASAVVAEDHLSALQKLMETTGTLPLYAGVVVLLLAAAAVIFLRKPAHRMQPAMARTASAGSSSRVPKTALESGSAARAVPPTRSESGYGSIQFISGPLSGRTYQISKEGFWIGRDPRCGAVLTDDTISAEHAWIVPVDGSVMVIDKGSSNGTYVNSVDSPRVSKISLKDGDKIFIGKKGAVATYFAT